MKNTKCFVNEKIRSKGISRRRRNTAKYEELLINNPKGQNLYYNEMNRHEMGFF